jgi:hypothetical protein
MVWPNLRKKPTPGQAAPGLEPATPRMQSGALSAWPLYSVIKSRSHEQLYKESIWCSFKFPVKVGVLESIVNAPRITNSEQSFKSNLTFCVFNMQTDAWCVHNRLFNANFDGKFKWTPILKKCVLSYGLF